MTDGKGKTIDCKGAIFIMTSNLASEEIAEHGMQLREEAERIISQRLEKKESKDEELEHIEISRNFKDEVVSCIIFFFNFALVIDLNFLLGSTNFKITLSKGRVFRTNQ